MPSGKIFLKHNFSSVTGYVIITFFENTAPAAELVTKRITIPAPHVERGDTVTGLNPVMHTAKFYQSSDGVTLETLLLTMSLDASIYNENIIDQYDYVVDRGEGSGSGSDIIWADPITDDTQIIDDRLDGYTKDQIRFEQRDGGIFREDEFDLLPGGGIVLLNGLTFGDNGQTYRVTVFQNVAQQFNGGDGSSTGGDGWDVLPLEDADFTGTQIDFDTALYNKICPVLYTGEIATVVFPDLTLIQNTAVRFTTHSVGPRYVELQLDAGDTVYFFNALKNVIYLGRGEAIELRIKDGVMYVTNYNGDAGRVGERFFGDRLELNTLYRDGTEYDQDDYPRLMEFINALPVGQVVDYTTWASSTTVTNTSTGVVTTVYPYKGLFAVNNITGKFRVPDDRNMSLRALKYTDTTDDPERLVDRPGGYQHGTLESHRHFTRGNYAQGGYSGGGNDFFRARSSNSFTDSNLIQEYGGVETRPNNIGLLPLIRI